MCWGVLFDYIVCFWSIFFFFDCGKMNKFLVMWNFNIREYLMFFVFKFFLILI